MDLADRVAIVTGATGSLGRAVTRDLAGAGLRLGLLGTRLDRLEALASEIGIGADQWHGSVVDLRHAEGTRSAVEAVVARFGHADILVHLVGGWTGGRLVIETPDAEFASMLDQHLWTTLNVTRAVVPHLAAGGWGRIVAVSSPVATDTPAKMAPYAIGKAAEETLLSTLAREVAGAGITVNMLLVRSIKAVDDGDLAPSAGGRSWTTPDEISAAFRYLLSDEAGIVTGARIPLHGVA